MELRAKHILRVPENINNTPSKRKNINKKNSKESVIFLIDNITYLHAILIITLQCYQFLLNTTILLYVH